MSRTPGLDGFLLKRGVINRSQQKRFFVLKYLESKLYYYKTDDTTKEPLGYIDLRNFSVEVPKQNEDNDSNSGKWVNRNKATSWTSIYSKNAEEYVFYIHTPTRMYELAAATPANLDYWKKGLDEIRELQVNSITDQETIVFAEWSFWFG